MIISPDEFKELSAYSDHSLKYTDIRRQCYLGKPKSLNKTTSWYNQQLGEDESENNHSRTEDRTESQTAEEKRVKTPPSKRSQGNKGLREVN